MIQSTMNAHSSTKSPIRALLPLLLCTVLGAGCAGAPKVKPESLAGRSVAILPVRGQPVIVMYQHEGLTVISLLGSAIEVASSGKYRAAEAERLNRVLPDFEPERILAEECAKLLKESTVVTFGSLEVVPEAVDLPGADALWAKETRPFKAGVPNFNKWGRLLAKWQQAPTMTPNSNASTLPAGALVVEVAFGRAALNHRDQLWFGTVIRLVDPSQNQVLHTAYVDTRLPITPVKETSDIRQFLHDFRKSANEAAMQALRRMKLILG